MRCLLFRAIQPDRAMPQTPYTFFVREAGQVRLPAGAERIAENVWLFCLPDNDALLATFRSIAKKHDSACQMLEFERGSSWQPVL